MYWNRYHKLNSLSEAATSFLLSLPSPVKSELMTCDAEGALGEREDLGGLDLEHEDRTTTFEVKAAAARPSSVPLRGPGFGEAFEHGIVGDLDGVALDHDV